MQSNFKSGNSNLDKALDGFEGMSNKDALDVGLVLQQILRGQDSILTKIAGNDKQSEEMREELRKLRQQMDKYDRAAAKYEEDKEKFIENVLSKAESLKAVGDKRDKIIANGVLQAQDAVKNARATQAVDKMEFERRIAAMPKVSVTSPGRLESGIANGQPLTQIVPEEVRIRHLRWVLPVGIPIDVPEAVADVLKNRRASEAETRERQAVLQKRLNNEQLTEELSKINQKYNTTSDLGPSVGEM